MASTRLATPVRSLAGSRAHVVIAALATVLSDFAVHNS